ncbi:MAG: substrate-binding domain-containing protein, partial [Spirochaetales bacterium]|nr:substrate-binding domain-containing protein [Spirochaetales bacterium]
MNKPLILVGDSIGRSYYPRPSHQEDFPLEDERHWYDREHMHWQVQKLPMPESSMDGPEGKRVICNIPMVHDDMNQFRYGLERVADSSGIELEVIETGLTAEDQILYAEKVVELAPDLVIHLMPAGDQQEGLYKKIYAAGIPIICSNLLPSREDLPYILSWTGPNDWEMSRELARHFAHYMDYKGGYTLISHFKGTSCDTARTWGVITELKKIAPDMVCLDHCSTQMDLHRSQEVVEKWIGEYGGNLKGIVSADSALVQKGIFRAMRKHERDDIICVSHWSPPEALEDIKSGKLRATTYQSGIIDGSLAMQTAV